MPPRSPQGKKINTMHRWLRLLPAVHAWAREPFDASRAPGEARRLLACRLRRFLSLMRDAVYQHPASPYLRLLRHAGCEYADLEAEVARNGLESTLRRLAAAGVYVTHDEMKGRVPIRRGSAVFDFRPAQFDNPLVTPHFIQSTSGSTGSATSIGISLDHYRRQLLHTALSIRFHGLEDAGIVLWLPVSEWSVSRALRVSKTAGRVERWFTQTPLDLRRGVSIAGLTALLRLHGLHVALPRDAPLSEPGGAVRQMAEQLRKHGRLLLVTYPSTAVRACVFAAREGVSLSGAVILAAGEPVTAARRSAIEASGARCLPLFGCTETGESAEGCLHPRSPDDMHLYEHKFALISRRMDIGLERPVDTPLFTTLDPQTPKLLLNGDTGDAGVVEERECGCPWGRLGYRTHLREVWSYSKLTAEGMTLPGDIVFSALEHDLPARFGGRPGDYQLISEPAGNGVTRYLLAVNPALGPLDDDGVSRAFREALSRGSYSLAADFLYRAGHLAVVRRAPVLQPGGKSLPVAPHRPAGAAGRRT